MTRPIDEIQEKARRGVVGARREVVDAAIDELVYDAQRSADDAWATVDRLRDENERLRADLALFAKRNENLWRAKEALIAEVARLKRALTAQAWAAAIGTMAHGDPARGDDEVCDLIAALPAPADYARGDV